MRAQPAEEANNNVSNLFLKDILKVLSDESFESENHKRIPTLH
jgi:hypothetical protein